MTDHEQDARRRARIDAYEAFKRLNTASCSLRLWNGSDTIRQKIDCAIAHLWMALEEFDIEDSTR